MKTQIFVALIFFSLFCFGAVQAEESSLGELNLKLEKIRVMQEAARIDIDRGGLLAQNGQLRLKLLQLEEKELLDRIKKAEAKSR